MSIESNLLTFFSINVDSNARKKGLDIFTKKRYKEKLFDNNHLVGEYEVTSDTDKVKYKILFKIEDEGKNIQMECTCPYNYEGLCKHRVAVLLAIIEKVKVLKLGNKGLTPIEKLFNTSVTIPFRNIDLDNYKSLPAYQEMVLSNPFYVEGTPSLNTSDKSISFALVDFNVRKKNTIIFKRPDAESLSIDCFCKSKQMPCQHALKVFKHLISGHSPDEVNFFDRLLSAEVQKKKLMAEYGFDSGNPADIQNFKFVEKNRLWSIQPKDENLKKLSQFQNWNKNLLGLQLRQNSEILLPSTAAKTKTKVELSMAYIIEIDLVNTSVVKAAIHPIVCKLSQDNKNIVSHIKTLEEADVQSLPTRDEADEMIVKLAKLSSQKELEKSLKTYGTGIYSLNLKNQADRTFVFKFYFDVLHDAIDYLSEKTVALTGPLSGYRISKQDLWSAQIGKNRIGLEIEIASKSGFIEIVPKVVCGKTLFDLKEVITFGSLLLKVGNFHYGFESVETAHNFQYFIENPSIKVSAKDLPSLMKNLIQPLSKMHKIHNKLNLESREMIALSYRVYLKEMDNYLLIHPKAVYEGDKEVNILENELLLEPKDDTFEVLERDLDFENSQIEFLNSLHPEFHKQQPKGFYYLSFDEVLKNGWFFNFFSALKEQQTEVLGFDKITKIKYNPNKPSVKVKGSSGIDWFDVKIEITYGTQTVSLKDVQKALLKRENFVKLGDGSIGLLPEEWLKKHESLLKMGEVNKDSLRVSKLHFSLMDELADELSDVKITKELADKKQKLLNFESIKGHKIPNEIKAELRPYQHHGYNWLCFLDEFGWGGCLADDMGLGKTLQMITFLQNQVNKFPDKTNLVVVPTSLLFNWEQELRKFSPNITFLIHSGAEREKELEVFKAYHVIITTYGLVMNDIENLKDFEFNYVILDESQAIKNPESQRFKAVRQLKARNRIVMTGTPVENNTFDLYAQMSFANPGLLGNTNFFKEQFSNAIDRKGDKDKAEQLKKLINPFILRRTKEQVIKDLPEKTETVLICEMEAEQRKVYDTFKEHYRQKLMNKIQEEGIGKSSMYMLEALLKLRQICDSPAILNDEESYGNDSIKIKELMSNIREKTGKHKILVFSQFVSMLTLIKNELELANISFEYLDGQVTNRQKVVENFVNDASIRVFLISLKAGGVGLNLTVADYVYLVDPWWNPAVEAQAIDRTHRIGQKNKVFAYKMICKDTIEEKVLHLQSRKKNLSDDLVSTEASFLKQLDKDDIKYLFS
jgi:uncharacterized Zn finger protein